MTVSNPASFSSIKAEFAGSNNFSQYYRGGPYVNSAQSSTISTTANGLAMSQFNGVTKIVLSATVSPASWSMSTKVAGTYTSVSVVCTPSGNAGAVTYSWSASGGFSANQPTSSSCSFSATVNSTTGSVIGVAHCVVKDATGQTATSSGCTLSITWTGQIQ